MRMYTVEAIHYTAVHINLSITRFFKLKPKITMKPTKAVLKSPMKM
jgi:hypothetical protein